jgi:putative PEP-CTERM system histidine kinase
MTAFLMHDLKNLMAQQALIVQNAPRLKHWPEFVDDAFRTIERSVERMRRLLEQLQRGASSAASTRVNLTPLLEEVVAEAADRKPQAELEIELEIEAYCEVRADRDRLAMIFSHALRNAQDATPADGQVRVRLSRAESGEAVVEVADTGCGMDEVFLRERLFKPFDTTKGASGMGVGAYQIREYVTALGGRVEVHSALGAGRGHAPAPGAATGDGERYGSGMMLVSWKACPWRS